MPVKTPFRILIIDDEKEHAEVVKQSINEKWPPSVADVTIESDFTKGVSDLSSSRPDVIVLDLYQGNPAQHSKKHGELIWKDVWEKHFSPVIIYTAGEAELGPRIPPNHPFVKVITKSKSSDQNVVAALEEFLPHIGALNNIRDEFAGVTQQILRTTCQNIWDAQSDEALRSKMLLRTARRRMGALMDMDTSRTSEKLISWEQFIYPPLEASLLTGDILFEAGQPKESATAYFLVLTPSCDMAIREDGSCRAAEILVARCENLNEYAKKCGVTSTTSESDFRKRLASHITQTQFAGYVLLPEYPSIMPPLAVNVRSLLQIPIGDISFKDTVPTNKFKRLLSIDSPFREQIVWAYLQIVGRPGLPETNTDQWLTDIWTYTVANRTS
jgi:CTP synthase